MTEIFIFILACCVVWLCISSYVTEDQSEHVANSILNDLNIVMHHSYRLTHRDTFKVLHICITDIEYNTQEERHEITMIVCNSKEQLSIWRGPVKALENLDNEYKIEDMGKCDMSQLGSVILR